MKLYKNSNGMHLTQETRKWKTVKNKRENRRKEKKKTKKKKRRRDGGERVLL